MGRVVPINIWSPLLYRKRHQPSVLLFVSLLKFATTSKPKKEKKGHMLRERTNEQAQVPDITTGCKHTCMQTCTHRTQGLSLKDLCTEDREKKWVKPAQKELWRLILWQISEFTRKFLEAVNRKWLSKSRWSMLIAGTMQEIAECLNGCKKPALLLRPWQSL